MPGNLHGFASRNSTQSPGWPMTNETRDTAHAMIRTKQAEYAKELLLKCDGGAWGPSDSGINFDSRLEVKQVHTNTVKPSKLRSGKVK